MGGIEFFVTCQNLTLFNPFINIGRKKKEKMDWVEPQSHEKFGKFYFGKKKFNLKWYTS